MKRTLGWLVGALLALALAAGCTRDGSEGNNDNNDNGTDITEQDESGEADIPGGGGDDTTPGEDLPLPDACGEIGVTVADLQQKPEGLDCTPPAQGENGFINLDQGVALNCVVVTAPLHSASEKLDGFFVADAGMGAYGGVKIVMPKGTAPAVNVGDVVSMVGDLKEYYCLTEFEATSIEVFAGAGAPAPVAVTAADLTSGEAEQYEGVLVTLTDAVVVAHDDFGGFEVEGGLTVDDAIFGDMEALEEGCTYATLTGVVDYSFGAYRLYPRSADDLVASGDECEVVQPTVDTISDIQTDDASLTCSDEAFKNVGSVALEGVVVMTPPFVLSKNKLDGFFVSDGQGGPNSGILFATDTSAAVSYAVGDVLTVEGDWTEYYCMTEIKLTSHEKTGDFEGDLPIAEVTTDDLQPDVAEQYEGMVVTLSDVEVTSELDEFGQFLVTGDIMIKIKFEDVTYEPVVGDKFASITGAINYDFGDYKIMPVSDSDLVLE